MKVVMLATGLACEVAPLYALRLIEQGRAVPAPQEKPQKRKAKC